MRQGFLIITTATLTAGIAAAGFFALTSHQSGQAPGSQALGPVPHPLAPTTSAGSWPSASTCRGHVPTAPFTGVAVNPPITTRAGSFAATAGAHLGIVEFYTAFGRPFSRYEARQAASLGALPLIQLNPRHASIAGIAAGKWDRYLQQYAAAVKAFGCPLALSFGHEMNGWWYPWGRPDTTPAQFIAAWRHIHTVFAAAHASNVIWSWDPDHGGTPARQWWPGAAYVNWIGIDGYQRPTSTFHGVFGRQLANIRSFTSKPVFLAETAAAPGPRQAAQIASLFAAVRQYRLTGLVWFDINRKEQWRVEGNPVASAAVSAGTQSLQH